MIGLIQRVTSASVTVDGKRIAHINRGLLALIGVEKHDTTDQARRLAERICGYRVFADGNTKMNLCLKDIAGGLLMVPQFTLAANTQKGMRPSFSSAASPEHGKRLYDYCVDEARRTVSDVETGLFGADMQIALINDGPVTFWLRATAQSDLSGAPSHV
ncbi:MAG: D-tyrosyl-tRNA(Tyr) deacylase [Gammaproteobacteria bacterium]|nr:D-tyrosyl-tRNA(Tyr) deacylase [Gammaproteobacteria bacterium]